MKNHRKGWRRTGLTLLVFLVVLQPAAASASSVPYDTYNYDYRESVVFTPAAYVPGGSISGVSLGIGVLSNPQDMCVAPDGLIYIADTGNNRIVVLDKSMSGVAAVIDSFDNNGKKDTFRSPYGVGVSDTNQLYIADTENERVVVLDKGRLVKIIKDPVSEVLEDGFVFKPLKVTIDYADRVYCIAKGMFQGIMVFEGEGDFTGFFGTINVSISAWDKIWKRLSTKEERSKQMLYIPTEFTGIDVDCDGFVYASNIDNTGEQAVRRLNPKGEDIIKKGENKNVGGDILTDGDSKYSGVSNIVDVVVREKGIYSLLDSRRGRIFTYDHEGNLLYIFGGIGSQTGTFGVPVAIEAVGDRILALDASRAEILVFTPTEYGSLINEAIGLRYDGDEALAVKKWMEVLKYDENFELANTGIGKAYLTAGDNKQAMHYLKLGMNRQYYSIAFKRYRNEFLKNNLGIMLSVVIVLLLGGKLLTAVLRKQDGRKVKHKGAFEDE